MTIRLLGSAAELTRTEWQDLYGTGRADLSHGYALFREHMEPGTPVLLTAADDAGPCAALHGALTTPASALFSHPWKLLGAEQLRRPEEDDAPQAQEDHAALLRAVTGASGDPAPGATALTRALGEAIVLRSFDSTEAGVRADLDAPHRHRALRALLAHAQQAVRDGVAGAICLPYVREEDETLRAALSRLGFRSAVLTAVTEFDVRGVASYDAYLAALTRHRRHVHRREAQAMADSALRLDTWPLAGHVEQVAALEARNIAKHGGRPNPQALIEARTAMATLLGDHVRVPVALDAAGEPVACSIHMADTHDNCTLMYGADESVSQGAFAYPCLTFYEPLRYAAEHGLHTVRLGFEGFNAKLRRGARLRTRETWLWTPDTARLAALHRVMAFLAARTVTHLNRLTGQTP